MGAVYDDIERRILNVALHVYKTRGERVAMRCALGDAAAICDLIAVEIEKEHTSRGRVKKRGQEMASAARRAGDAVWAMRDKITFDPPPADSSPPTSPPLNQKDNGI